MSKNFELLRKAELLGRGARGLPSSAISPFLEPQHAPISRDPETSKQPIENHAEELNWTRAFAVLRRRWRIVLFVAVSIFAVAAAVAFGMKPEYAPVARIEIDPPGAETFSLQQQTSPFSEEEYLATQGQNLQSDALALDIIRKLRLDRLPAFRHQTVRNNEYATSSTEHDQLNLTPAENDALRTFRKSLRVTQDSGSWIVSVSFAAHDPQLAALVTNTVAEQFIARAQATQNEAVTESTGRLERQLDDIRDKMESSNHALAEFQRQTGVVDEDETRNTFGDRLNELNRQVTEAQAERIQLQSFLEGAQKGESASLPQVRDNPIIQKLTQTLAETRVQLSQDQVLYGANHPNIKKLQNQVNELEAQLATQRKRTLDQLQTTYAAARSREAMLNEKLKGMMQLIGQMGEYNARKKDAQANTVLYNQLLARVKEAGIAAASKSSNIRIIDPAYVLDSPSRPDRPFYLAAGFFAGIIGGVIVAMLREGVEHRLHTPEDIKRWTGMSAISVIPVIERNHQAMGLFSLKRNKSLPTGRFLLDRPLSPESEALRALHTSVMLSRVSQRQQTLLIASSLAGEGKTMVAVNLALALSQEHKVCLIDADLRRPGVAAALGLSSDQGLSDVLNGLTDWSKVLLGTLDAPNLSVIPAGIANPCSAHLLSTEIMSVLVRTLRDLFEFVVIDSPPLLPYADGLALSNFVDGVVFVARSGVTSRDAMVRSMELLAEVNAAPLTGIVLNAADFAAYSPYHYYDYGKPRKRN